jgi:hypothetical protein
VKDEPSLDQVTSHAALGDVMCDVVASVERQQIATANSARWWRFVDLFFGVPTAALAAVAGAAGLASAAGRIPAAVLALIVAAMAATQTFLKSHERFTTEITKLALLQTLAADAKLVAAFEGSRASAAEIRNQIAILVERQQAIALGEFDSARALRESSVGRSVEPGNLAFLAACATNIQMPQWMPGFSLAQQFLEAGITRTAGSCFDIVGDVELDTAKSETEH